MIFAKTAEYFKSVFFDLAPLLSIPLYQQHKPREYIYGENYTRNFTVREAEVLANRLNPKNLVHPETATAAILKTSLVSKQGETDRLNVTAYSFRTVEHVDYIPKLGGDGFVHDVPVEWLEYIPVEKQSPVTVSALDLSEPEYRKSPAASAAVPHTFFHRLLAVVNSK